MFRTLSVAALAALLVVAGAAAALPGAAPGGHGGPTTDGAPTDGQNATGANASSNATDRAGANATGGPANAPAGGPSDRAAGPPADLPGPVPDFVSEIHGLVGDLLDGTLSGPDLGAAISDLTPDDGSGEATDGGTDETASDASGAAA